MSTDLITKAASLIRQGELVAFPTETVYGLGADASNDAAIKKIYAAKKRPANNPLIIHVERVEQILAYAEVPHEHLETFHLLSKAFCPGPLTFVLEKSATSLPPLSPLVSAGTTTAAFRIPQHPLARALIHESKTPIAAPSANPSNYISPTTAQHVQQSLGEAVSLILDGGACTVGIESTVIALLKGSPPTLLRPGGVTLEELNHHSKVSFQLPTKTTTPAEKELLSPGQLAVHYSPSTKLMFRAPTHAAPSASRIGLIEFCPSPHEHPYTVVRTLSKNGNLDEVAHKLFSTLRELDLMNLDLIIVDSCHCEGIGRAIMDRLQRAVHK